MSSPLLLENVWLQQHKYEDAELSFRQTHSGSTNNTKQQAPDSLAQEIARVRQDIQKVLNSEPVEDTDDFDDKNDAELFARIEVLERQNKQLWKLTDALKVDVSELKAMIANLGPDIPLSPGKPQETSAPSPAKPQAAPAPQKPAAADDDDDDIDLFGSDDEETKTLKEKRLREYAEKKAKKPALIAKSSVVLDVKPWDDETDMAEMEKRVRSIEQDGLVWGASKLVEVGYGIKKLSIICVVEDDKVSIEDLSEKITDENEDLVQSVDVAAFNKI